MSRDQLVADACAAGKAAKHNLRFIRRNPEKVDQSKVMDMKAYLEMIINAAENEMKNARRLGRTSLRNRLRKLVVSIIAH